MQLLTLKTISSNGKALVNTKRSVLAGLHARVAPPLLQTGRTCCIGVVCSAAPKYDTVADVMVKGRKVHSCKPDDSVDTALELLVQHQITGLPVVDLNNVVVGVVSDFDLLALDTVGRSGTDGPMFPTKDETWQAFRSVRNALAKGTGKKVRDVMTRSPLTVKETTSLNEATRLLLQKRIRRLPVVDGNGRLVGLVSRSNVIRVALELRKQAASSANGAA